MRKISIMIVTDSLEILIESVKKLCEAGYKNITGANAKEAMGKIETTRVDIVVGDVLALWGYWGVAQRIKESEELSRKTRVVLLDKNFFNQNSLDPQELKELKKKIDGEFEKVMIEEFKDLVKKFENNQKVKITIDEQNIQLTMEIEKEAVINIVRASSITPNGEDWMIYFKTSSIDGVLNLKSEEILSIFPHESVEKILTLPLTA